MRSGIHTIVIPERNKKDLEEIPKHIRRKLSFVYAKDMDEILEVALIDRAEVEKKAPLKPLMATPAHKTAKTETPGHSL